MTEQQLLPDGEAIVKARIVFDAMRAANLRPPLDFDQGSAELLWGAAVGVYEVAVITHTCGMWVKHHDEFATLSQFTTMADFYTGEQRRAQRAERAPNHVACVECADVHWVTIDPDTTNRHVRPCSMCMPDRYELYQRGHFDGEHVEKGGCPKCWDYLPSLRHKAKAKAR